MLSPAWMACGVSALGFKCFKLVQLYKMLKQLKVLSLTNINLKDLNDITQDKHSLYQIYPIPPKHAAVLCFCWENVSVLSFVMLTPHPTVIALLACEFLATKILHIYRKWSSQTCRLRPHTQLLWEHTPLKAMVHAASPNWSPPLAQVLWQWLQIYFTTWNCNSTL